MKIVGTSRNLCGFERFLFLRQARQEHLEALEKIERGDALLRQPGTGRFDVKNRRLRESQRAQRSAKERASKAPLATKSVLQPTTATMPPDTAPAVSETAIETFKWQQKRPPRR